MSLRSSHPVDKTEPVSERPRRSVLQTQFHSAVFIAILFPIMSSTHMTLIVVVVIAMSCAGMPLNGTAPASLPTDTNVQPDPDPIVATIIIVALPTDLESAQGLDLPMTEYKPYIVTLLSLVCFGVSLIAALFTASFTSSKKLVSVSWYWTRP